MTREIKFRAWDKTSKEMITGLYLDFQGRIGLWNHEETEIEFAEYPNLILMQFTGMKDKNGKEIFEGDIIRMIENFFGRIVAFNAVIEYQPAAFWFRGLDFNYTDCNWHHFNAEDREIIGNIYENPGLCR